MPITFDAKDEIPEGLRAVAKTTPDGKFVVSALPEGWAIEDVGGLKSALTEARAERNAAKAIAKKFDGLDPEVAQEAREALEKMRAGSLKSSKEIDDYKASVEAKFSADAAKLAGKLDARTKALREKMVRGELAPIVAAKGGSDSLDAILVLAERFIRLDEADDGTLKTSIVDAAGKPRVTKKGGSADPMGYEELVDEMREAPSTRGLFRATGTGGAGATSQAGGAGRAANPGQLMTARELLDRANARSS